MCATPSLRPMFSFSGWVIDRIDIDWDASKAFVYLRRDGRIQQFKCSQCHWPMGKMRENDRKVQDLPFGTIKVNLLFTAYQGRCSNCKHIETVTIPGLTPKAQATDRLKQQLATYVVTCPAIRFRNSSLYLMTQHVAGIKRC